MSKFEAHTKTRQLVPKLRFPEFDGAWKKYKLDKIFNYRNGGRFEDDVIDNGKIILISLNSLDIQGKLKDDQKKVDIDIGATDKMLEKDELVMVLSDVAHGNFLGLTAIVPENNKYILNYRMGALKAKEELSSLFVAQQINRNQKYFKLHGQGSSQLNLTKADVLSFEPALPTLPEQQKIASFLSAVDEKIQQLTRKKELLEQYKKGVMQQLFSGKLRFKDENGKPYPKWEEKKLGDVAVVNMGQSPDSKSYNNESIGLLLIQGNADIKGRVTSPRQWTSEPTKTCEIGDLILTVRAPVGSISKSVHNACIGRGVCSIKNNKNSIIEYLYQFLLDFEDKWKRIEQGSTFTAVSGDDIKSIKLKLPSLEEQQKIASFLTALDAKLENVATQIAHTQTFRKGLLQQMFV